MYFYVFLRSVFSVFSHEKKLLSPGLKIWWSEECAEASSRRRVVYFDNVRVPQRYCIGDEGKGFKIQMQQFQEERMFLSASVLIVLEQCIAKTIEYCQDRHAFGKAIIENQSIQFSELFHTTLRIIL